MSCCKDTKFNLLLKFDQTQKTNIQFQAETVLNLCEVLNWEEQKAKTVVEFATERGFCLIESNSTEAITKLSTKLALKSIPHEVKLSKK